MEVLSIVIPLLETRRLFIPGRGEAIEAAEGFQLFATQTLRMSSASTLSTRNGKDEIFLSLFSFFLSLSFNLSSSLSLSLFTSLHFNVS
jgi:midasin